MVLELLLFDPDVIPTRKLHLLGKNKKKSMY